MISGGKGHALPSFGPDFDTVYFAQYNLEVHQLQKEENTGA